MSNIFTEEQMNKVVVGKTYMSWKEICEEAGIPYKTGGKAQSFQKLEFNRYFEFEKIGRKYTILLRREFPLLKMTAPNSPYRKILQLLILDLLSTSPNNKISVTQDNLFLMLSMVNKDYKHYRKKENLKMLADELKLNSKVIDMFYIRHSSRFKDIVCSALNSLKSQFLLSWDKVDRISYSDYTTKIMDDFEKEILLQCKSDIAQLMGMESEQEIYSNGKYPDFIKKVILEYNARTETTVRYFFSTYDIIYNPDISYVDKKKRKIYDSLNKDYKLKLQYELNDTIITNIIKNVNERTDNCMYIENEKALTNKLIKIKR